VVTQVAVNARRQAHGEKAGPAMMNDVVEDPVPQESQHHARDQATGDVQRECAPRRQENRNP
jgi:hypothetical protein